MYTYYITKGTSPAPPELLRWELVERYHWTLDYIDSLSMSDIHEYLSIKDARHKAKT